jgi:hypothetical protein
MKASYTKKDYPLCPSGTFMARVVRLVYLGTQQTSWQGQEKKTPQINISFELPTELYEFKEGESKKPFVISNTYSHMMGKKAKLRPITEAILGVALKDEEAYAFDHDELIGLPCQLTVVHTEKDGNTYANIGSVSPLLKGVVMPPQVNESKILSFDKWNDELFKSLPEFLRTKITASPEYGKMVGKPVQTEITDEDLPF